MSVFFDAPARLVYTTSCKSRTQEAIGAAGHLTAQKGERTLFFYRAGESSERVMLATSTIKKIARFQRLLFVRTVTGTIYVFSEMAKGGCNLAHW
ncbi:MAG TPA: hypothetical protein DCL51_09630 [Ruthenibacterium lactatiformans]|nr:hypothetical protein [Ruthenibacterium lactatiformans]